MLFHLPLRYEDRARTYPICELQLHSQSIEGEIERCEITQGKRRMLVCYINDGTGRIGLRFFNFSAAQKNAMQTGKVMRCFGEVRRGRYGFEMAHPEYSIKESRSAPTDPALATLTPVYPTTEGMKQLSIRAIADQAVELLRKYDVPDYLPPQYRPSQQSLKDALLLLHRPPHEVDLSQLELGLHPAQARLAFEELLAQNLSLLQLRQKGQAVKAVALPPSHPLEASFLATLPFAPTNAQSRVVAEVKGDLQQPYPMMRLVRRRRFRETPVAALCFNHDCRGLSSSLDGPTEILSEQHGLNFVRFQPLGIEAVAGR